LKILLALSRFPWPTDKGDKLRAWNHILGLSQTHDIHLFCLSDEPVSNEALEKVSEVCASVQVFQLHKASLAFRMLRQFFGKMPMQVAYFSDLKAIAEFQALANKINPDKVMIQLARMAEFADGLPYPKLIDYQDAFSKGLERRREHNPWWMRRILQMECNRLRKYENQIFDKFEQKIIISKQDAMFIDHPDHAILEVIPNGVDTDFYKPEPRAKTVDLLFTGNMGYEPNVNCVKYMIGLVLPLLDKEFPHIQFVAAGKVPSLELKRIKSRHLQLTGWVDDLRKYYQQARIFVAPMQIGIGMQNKILEAMSMGLPVITTSLANNAIGAEHGKEVWIADSPEKVAEAIAFLMNNTDLALKIGQNARNLMVNEFSWNKQNERLNRLVSGTQIEPIKVHQS
jgi:sugar transferase (PEP-CTERM/EpsH1 system associated)